MWSELLKKEIFREDGWEKNINISVVKVSPQHGLPCFWTGGCLQLPKPLNFLWEKETIPAGVLGVSRVCFACPCTINSLETLPVTLRLQKIIDLRLKKRKNKEGNDEEAQCCTLSCLAFTPCNQRQQPSPWAHTLCLGRAGIQTCPVLAAPQG